MEKILFTPEKLEGVVRGHGRSIAAIREEVEKIKEILYITNSEMAESKWGKRKGTL